MNNRGADYIKRLLKDKERFKKSYFTEIQSIVKNESFKQKYDTQSTPYKATVKVYNEWFDLEK